jgi:uncharacterized protein (DUF433 family)
MNMEERIVVNPKIMVGKPIIRGTRIPIDAILNRLADGMTISDILEEYPNITEEDIRAALVYVSHVIAGEQIIPMVEAA